MYRFIIALLVVGALTSATGATRLAPPVPLGARKPTWEPDTQVTNNSMNNYLYFNNGHKLVIARNGVRHLVWQGGSSVYYKRYYPGLGWTPDTLLGSAGSYYPSIALDSNGTSIYVVWEAFQHIGNSSYHIFYDRCTPTSSGNGGWDASQDVCTSHDSAYHYYPTVACGPGRVAVSWYEYNAGSGISMIGFRECLSGTWQNQVELDSVASPYSRSMPSLAVARNGDVFLTYCGDQPVQPNSHVYVKRRLSGSWQQSEDATPMLPSVASDCVALNPLTGNPHVVCAGTGSDGYHRIYHNWRGISGWQSSLDTVSQPGPTPSLLCYSPNLEFAGDGTAEVSWHVFPKPNGGYGIIFNERSPAGAWGSPIWLSDSSTSYSDYYPSVTTDSVNGVYVAWQSSRTGLNQLRLRHRAPATDVGFVALTPPGANVDSVLSSVAPVCTTCNYGSLYTSYAVRLRIGSFYAQSVAVTSHPPHSRLAVIFPAFSNWPRGSFLARCSLGVSGDTWFANDTLSKLITGHVHDVQCDTVFAPPAIVDSSQPSVAPKVRISNHGSDDESFNVAFRVADGYNQTLAASVAHGDTHTYSFPLWTHLHRGTWLAACSTKLSNDVNHANDALQRQVIVEIPEVALLGIVSPVGLVDSSDWIVPQALVRNNGSCPATFDAWFRFDSTGGLIAKTPRAPSEETRKNRNTEIPDSGLSVFRRLGGYQAHITVTNLSVGADSLVSFPAWPHPHRINSYVSRCSLFLAGDLNRADDTMSGAFVVRYVPPPQGGIWTQMADLPFGNRQKGVKDGGALASGLAAGGGDTGYVFAFKGNNTYEFYRYNTVTNAWVAKESIPAFNRNSKKKGVKKGSSLAFGTDGEVYATKGNNTLDFWQYDPPTGVWTQKADVPTGGRAVREGTGLVAAGNADYLYLLKGAGTSEFYRFDVTGNSWTALSSPPTAGFKNGSCIAWDGSDTIFVLKGSTNEFFAYSIAGRNWLLEPALPMTLPGSTRRKKVKDGAGLAYDTRIVYALKGDGTNEFWTYQCDSQTWLADNPMQPSPMNKTVKAGGALVYVQSRYALYALRGNNTREFWMYTSRTLAGKGPLSVSSTQSSSSELTVHSALSVSPNPFTGAVSISYSLPRGDIISLRLYDVTGKLIKTFRAGYAEAGICKFELRSLDLPDGIYLLQLEGRTVRLNQKLIVE